MSWDSRSPFDYLVAVVDGLTSMSGTVYEGEPEAIDSTVAGDVLIAGFDLQHKTVGRILQREQRYLVDFYYRLGGDEQTAERTMIALVDQFITAWHADLTLGGTAQDSRIDAGLADQPQYPKLSDTEHRRYPILVTAVLRSGPP